MRITILLLVCLTTLAQSPPAAPQNLRLSEVSTSTSAIGDVIQVPVVFTNDQFIASWYPPPSIQRTNLSIFVQPIATKWTAEVSTDGVNWIGGQSEWAEVPLRETRLLNHALNQPCYSCLHSIGVQNITDQVRIRLVAY